MTGLLLVKLVLIKASEKLGLLDLFLNTHPQSGLALQRNSSHLTNVEINGEVVSSVSGGRVPAPIWKEFMEKVVEDLPIEEWPADPSDIDKVL